MNDLRNRIKKNYDHLMKWAKRSHSNCFRLYDCDIKEFPIAIDYYANHFLVHYFEFPNDREDKFQRIEEAVIRSLEELFVNPKISWKMRFKRRELEQYEKLDNTSEIVEVCENGLKFRVNLSDYLDTGLFLDHRETRKMVGDAAKDKRVLNLFSYTCSFSVYAAKNGACTTSVDLSNTYLEWGKQNFLLNGISLHTHQFIREDALTFLKGITAKYDLIVIDPPTISRSKKLEKMFDIQKDYGDLLDMASEALNPNGVIYFSTNFDGFKMEEKYARFEISHKTIPYGFRRPHRSWRVF